MTSCLNRYALNSGIGKYFWLCREIWKDEKAPNNGTWKHPCLCKEIWKDNENVGLVCIADRTAVQWYCFTRCLLM